MASVKNLLECATINLETYSDFGSRLAKGLINQYLDLKAAGAKDEDDVDESLEKYPHCNLKF
jgi:hypothetical protein